MPLRRSLLAAVTLLAIGVPGFSRCFSEVDLRAAQDYESWSTICALYETGLLSYNESSIALRGFMEVSADEYYYLQKEGRMAIKLMKMGEPDCMKLINSF